MTVRILLALLLSTLPAQAASIRLTWNASSSSTTADPGTVNVYRRTATCPSSTSAVSWLHLATNVPAYGPYIDSAASTHYPHCYYVTAIVDGKESPPSNMIFIPAAPVTLTGTWQK